MSNLSNAKGVQNLLWIFSFTDLWIVTAVDDITSIKLFAPLRWICNQAPRFHWFLLNYFVVVKAESELDIIICT